jgi:hypothetical protein
MNTAARHRRSDLPRWSELTSATALACALSPILGFVGIVPSAIITLGPMAAIVLSATTFATTRRRDVRSERAIAGAALAVVVVWVLLFAVFALELLYGG